jgi:hypothetical protein
MVAALEMGYCSVQEMRRSFIYQTLCPHWLTVDPEVQRNSVSSQLLGRHEVEGHQLRSIVTGEEICLHGLDTEEKREHEIASHNIAQEKMSGK